MSSGVFYSWAYYACMGGFNALCTANIPVASTIGYLSVIDSPATELATVSELLKRSISISERLQLNEIVIVLDEAIYAKAQMIRWKEEMKSRIVIRLGEFHTIMSFGSAIGKILKDAGLKVSDRFLKFLQLICKNLFSVVQQYVLTFLYRIY